jgi:diaminopimelate epimerase
MTPAQRFAAGGRKDAGSRARTGLLAFEKWEGLGNDFVLVELAAANLTPAQVTRLCDRRRGVGADGVLHLEGVSAERPRMIVRNADGSRPEMCGNGLRCVAAYVSARTGAAEVEVATDAGDRACTIEAGADGFEVTVAMGVARRSEDLSVALGGRTHSFHVVDVGNPHAITFEPYDDAAIDVVGPAVATTPAGGINVEFCRVHEGERLIEITVWERGVGRTLACGTGACAVAVAACETGRAPFGVPLRLRLPGGDLEVTVDERERTMLMKGPARRVFVGETVIR